MNLIGINGFKTSGKDTAFGFVRDLAERDGESAVRLAFADKLKVLAGLTLSVDALSEEGLKQSMDGFKEYGELVVKPSEGRCGSHFTITGRQYLQNLGAEARKVFGDSFWVDQVLPREVIEELADDLDWPEWVCVTDVRYPNEAQRVLDLGGEVWEVVRPGLESDGHSSETPLPRDLVTLTLLNDGTLDDLKLKVADSMGTFGCGG